MRFILIRILRRIRAAPGSCSHGCILSVELDTKGLEMNGCGDIEIKYTSRDDFSKMPQEQKEWLLFSFMQSIAHTCRHRPENCDKKYVKLRHVVISVSVIVAFLAGLGIVQVKIFMPGLIKTAVASALAAM